MAEEIKERLIKKGYYTVNKLIEKLQELKNAGYGNELIGTDCEHISGCEFDDNLNYVVIY